MPMYQNDYKRNRVSQKQFKMSARLKRNLDFLRVLSKAKPSQRRAILETATNDLVYCICEIIDNILHGTVRLSKQRQKKLQHYKKLLRFIANKKVPVKKKREILVQNGEGILPALIVPILALAGSLLSHGTR